MLPDIRFNMIFSLLLAIWVHHIVIEKKFIDLYFLINVKKSIEMFS